MYEIIYYNLFFVLLSDFPNSKAKQYITNLQNYINNYIYFYN